MGAYCVLSAALHLMLLTQIFIPPTHGELFTALVHMEGLLDLEVELLGSLNSYITAERERYTFNG